MVILAGGAIAVAAEDLGVAGLEVFSPGRLDVDELIARGVVAAAIEGADKRLARVLRVSGEGICVDAGGHDEGGVETVGGM
jgi:hypothetical protein